MNTMLLWACFMMYSGKYVDPVSGKTVKKKGEVADTVKELSLETYSGKGHVLYINRFFTSWPLVEELQERGIYTVGKIKRNAAGFPKELRDVTVTPERGVEFSTKTHLCESLFISSLISCLP